jgi:hypothetical protein
MVQLLLWATAQLTDGALAIKMASQRENSIK